MAVRRGLAQDIIAGLKEVEKDRQGQPAKLVAYQVRLPNIRALRQKLKLTQAEFARRYCLNARTVQDWEQGRAQPDPMVRAYLTVISHNPRAVEKALASTQR